MSRDFFDPYTYPGSDVLANKPGLRDEEALKQFEYEKTAVRARELRDNPIAGKFDLDHLKAVHAHLFQDVYEWAGRARVINISKGGTGFARAEFIEAEAARLNSLLVKENSLKGLEKPQFVERLAYHYSELNALHPFREGNGRSTREFLGQLSREAGYEIDQTRIDNSKDQWNQAAKRSFSGDLEPIKQIFLECVRPSRALAFDKLPEAEALAKHPELKSAFDGLRETRGVLAERFPGNEKAQAHYFEQARSEVLRRLDTGKAPGAAAEHPVVQSNQTRAGSGSAVRPEDAEAAQAFRTGKAEDVVKQYPRLAPAVAAMEAAKLKLQADGLAPGHCATVLALVHSRIADNIERGASPQMQVRVDQEIRAEPSKGPER